MFKKLILLSPILLALPFAASISDIANSSSFAVFATSDGEKGEYKGYTYTQVGLDRYYDTHDLTPKIVKNFWAPTGYKFTLSLTDKQINDILDQTEDLENNYAYVEFSLSYNKFGMKIDIKDFGSSFADRDECFAYFKDEINNYESFYELENIQADTELSIDLKVSFYGIYTSYNYYFSGEEEVISPVDQSAFIETKVSYDETNAEVAPKITISAVPVSGFFNEDPLRNQYGYLTDEIVEKDVEISEGEYVHYDFCAKYTMMLYAYDSVEIADATDGPVDVTYPNHDLPIKAKLEFVSGGKTISVWSKEFTIGDPEFKVTVDGFDDRDSVQVGSEHEYALEFDTLNNEKLTKLNVKAQIEPIRIAKNEKLIEYYDLAIMPDAASEYYLIASILTHSSINDRYSFTKIDDNHYVLRNVPLTQYEEVYVLNRNNGDEYYNNYMPETIATAGVYDINFDLSTTTDEYFTLNYVGPISYADNYYINVNGSNVKGLTSSDLGKTEQYALGVSLNAGDVLSVTDGGSNSVVNTSTWECCGFTINESGQMVVTNSGKYNIYFYLYSSRGMNIVLKSSPLPDQGQEGYIYYVASPDEVKLHAQGKDEEFLNKPFGGQYAIWNSASNSFTSFDGITLFEFNPSTYTGNEDLLSLACGKATIDFLGDWKISFDLNAESDHSKFACVSDSQRLEVSTRDKSGDYILLKSSFSNEALPDEINLLNGGKKIDLIPTIPSYEEGIKYYHTHTMEKEGVVGVEEKEDGRLTLTTLNPGVTTLTFSVDCELFPTITKTVSIRVLDAIYDVAEITVPDEFHYAGKDLTASLSIRGFTRIQNIDIAWDITNKKGDKVKDEKINARYDATVTLLSAESDDYTFVAYYEGIKVNSLTVQVRYADLNKFLRTNVWWIVLITISLLAFAIFLSIITRRAKTTVQRIERVYEVYCQCISNDSLSIGELKRIKHEITHCLHKVEDANIDSLNQYEKTLRYLRKSLNDTKKLLKRYDTLSVEEKSVMYEGLNNDLSKALVVAREIENAKDLIEAYHLAANKHNFEEIKEEKPKKKSKK